MTNIQFLPILPENELGSSLLTGNPAFTDQILRPEYRERKLQFVNGANWLRIVPAIAPSAHSRSQGSLPN